MKKLLSRLFWFVFAAAMVPLVGQEAKIMILEKPDSQRLSRAYEKYKEAQAEWDAVKTSVAAQYVNEVHGKTVGPKQGWESIQFSADFRAVVPASSQYANHSYSGCMTLTNAGGTGFVTNNAAITALPDSSANTMTFSDADDLTVKQKK